MITKDWRNWPEENIYCPDNASREELTTCPYCKQRVYIVDLWPRERRKDRGYFTAICLHCQKQYVLCSYLSFREDTDTLHIIELENEIAIRDKQIAELTKSVNSLLHYIEQIPTDTPQEVRKSAPDDITAKYKYLLG